MVGVGGSDAMDFHALERCSAWSSGATAARPA